MTYTAAFSASTPTRRRESLPRARLVLLMIREMALSNDEMAEVIADLSHSLNMRENPIIAESETEAELEESDSDDEEYDENASDDENDSDDEEYDENASDDENSDDENASDDEMRATMKNMTKMPAVVRRKPRLEIMTRMKVMNFIMFILQHWLSWVELQNS